MLRVGVVTTLSLSVLVKFTKEIEKDESAEDKTATEIADILGSREFNAALGRLIRGFSSKIQKASLESLTYEPCVPWEGAMPEKPKVNHPA